MGGSVGLDDHDGMPSPFSGQGRKPLLTLNVHFVIEARRGLMKDNG